MGIRHVLCVTCIFLAVWHTATASTPGETKSNVADQQTGAHAATTTSVPFSSAAIVTTTVSLTTKQAVTQGPAASTTLSTKHLLPSLTAVKTPTTAAIVATTTARVNTLGKVSKQTNTNASSSTNTADQTTANTPGNSHQTVPSQTSSNNFLDNIIDGINGFLKNLSLPSGNGNSNSGGLFQALKSLNGILGTFLPKEEKELLALMASNRSALTVQNLVKIAAPLAQTFGVQALAGLGISQGCSRDLNLIVNAIISRQPWALKMLDAMFKIQPNLYDAAMTANPKLLGSYDECLDVSGGKPGEEVKGQYCTATTHLQLPPTLVSPGGGGNLFLGLCVSSTCSSSDIQIMIDSVEKRVYNGSVPLQFSVTCHETKKWEIDMIIVTCILSILGTIIVFATLYDAFAVHMRKPRNSGRQIKTQTNGHKPDVTKPAGNSKAVEMKETAYSNGGYIPSEPDETKRDLAFNETNVDTMKTANGKVSVPVDSHPDESKPPQRGRAEQICLAFSMYSNGVKLLGTNQGAGSLGAVNGVRFLSMAWVILGHTYFFALGYDSNTTSYFSKNVNNWEFMAIPYAGVSVDSFFTLSGILVAYLTLRELKKVGGGMRMNWIMFYFHRFWRLTPPYMLVIMVGTVVLPYLVHGPMASSEDIPFMHGCRKGWWTNLLYVNNYVTDDSCLGWSWYLANDMQFYIISPLILVPFFYNAFAGAVISAAFMIATVGATGFVAWKHEYPAQLFSPFQHPPKDGDYGNKLYIPSYARMGPYIVGLVTGYLLYRLKCQCRIPRRINLLCWVLCIGTSCAIIYGQYTDGDSHIFSLWENVIFLAINRTAWGMAVAWIIFACATGNGGWINELLSWKAYIPLGRLTYCAYLVHPLVMIVYYMSRRSPVYFTHYEAIYLFLANMVMSYGVAFVTSLFFESPMMGLEKALLKKGH